MSLDSNVQSRFSAQILINASNPQNSGATTIDTTRLANAETDVIAAIQALAGVAYTDSDATIVLYATEGVLVRLMWMTGQVTYDAWTEWKKAVKDELAPIQGRDRILPSTRSKLQPTEDAPNAKPFADKTVFGKMLPNTPATNPFGNRDYLSDS